MCDYLYPSLLRSLPPNPPGTNTVVLSVGNAVLIVDKRRIQTAAEQTWDEIPRMIRQFGPEIQVSVGGTDDPLFKSWQMATPHEGAWTMPCGARKPEELEGKRKTKHLRGLPGKVL